MPRSAATAERAFDALGDPTRRRVFRLLQGGERSVGDLAAELPVSRPAVSQHLRVLKDGGLVIDQAIGTRRVYRPNPDGVAALRAWLDRVWEDALTSFQKAAEAHNDASRHSQAAPDHGQEVQP